MCKLFPITGLNISFKETQREKAPSNRQARLKIKGTKQIFINLSKTIMLKHDSFRSTVKYNITR